jgi:hypothetical protein
VGRLLEAFNRPDVAELQGLIFMTNCCIAQPSVEELRKRGGQLGVEVVLYDRDRILAAVRQQPDLLRRHFPFVCTTETLKGPSVRANLIAQQCRAVLTRVAASNLPGTYMIRNQARLSAFAITPRDIDERPWLREEARLMRQIVERGVGVHQILCPAVDLLAAVTDTGGVSGDMQTELLRPGTRGHCAERVAVLINYLTEILPRITRVDCHFVLTGGPVANRYVFGSEITISGHKTSGDTEYILSHITEHPGHIHAVSEEFDLIFEDAAEHLLGKEWDPDDAELAEELRGKVVERLQSLLDFLGAPPTEDDSTGESREQ